jgi:hypothetical protein
MRDGMFCPMRGAIVAIALLLSACGVSTTPSGQAPNTTPSPPAATGGPITWPAVSLHDSAAFSIDLSAKGSVVSKVDIRSRYGTVSVGGRDVAALVYEQIPWSNYTLVLYQALAVEAHSWTVFWFYCRGKSLFYVYWESTNSSKVNREPMTGSCLPATTADASVSWPAVSMQAPAPVPGFRAHGDLLEIVSAAPGHAVIEGKSWVLYPYATVDCSNGCGTPGWYELHSLLWDGAAGDAAYVIVYFITGQPHTVQIEYGLEMLRLGRVPTTSFQADWARV